MFFLFFSNDGEAVQLLTGFIYQSSIRTPNTDSDTDTESDDPVNDDDEITNTENAENRE